MQIYFKTRKTQKLSAGSSKMLGNPHVPEGFEWPFCDLDGEIFDLTFMCQINCAEVHACDPDSPLPMYGMLYFFYDLDTMPDTSAAMGGARVIYYDGYLSCLCEMILTDEHGEGMTFPEQEMIFCNERDGASPNHLLTGETDSDGRILLLQIDAFETDEANINFCGDYTLNFYIHPEKLAKKDFSDINVRRVEAAR